MNIVKAREVVLIDGVETITYEPRELECFSLGEVGKNHEAVLRKRRREARARKAETEMKIRNALSVVAMGACGVVLIWAATL